MRGERTVTIYVCLAAFSSIKWNRVVSKLSAAEATLLVVSWRSTVRLFRKTTRMIELPRGTGHGG